MDRPAKAGSLALLSARGGPPRARRERSGMDPAPGSGLGPGGLHLERGVGPPRRNPVECLESWSRHSHPLPHLPGPDPGSLGGGGPLGGDLRSGPRLVPEGALGPPGRGAGPALQRDLHPVAPTQAHPAPGSPQRGAHRPGPLGLGDPGSFHGAAGQRDHRGPAHHGRARPPRGLGGYSSGPGPLAGGPVVAALPGRGGPGLHQLPPQVSGGGRRGALGGHPSGPGPRGGGAGAAPGPRPHHQGPPDLRPPGDPGP